MMVSRFVYGARVAYLVAAALMVAAVLIVVFVAGMSLFASATFWDRHMELGYSAGLVVAVLIVLAFPSRLPRANAGLLIALLVLYMIQTILPTLRSSVPAIAALHPVNALAIFAVSVAQTRAAWRLVRAGRRVTVVVATPLPEST